MASLTISPGGPLRGTLSVPGDKSITHRAVILSALAEGESSVRGYSRGEDCLRMVQAFRSLGVPIEEEPDCLRVRGKGLWGLRESSDCIDCGNSGTAIRLLAGLLAGQDFFTVLTGDESIRRRPMGRVIQPLRSMGADITGRQGGELAPLALAGSRLKGFSYRPPISSAQVKSSLLLAGLFAEGVTEISEPQQSRDHTERMFRYLQIPLEVQGTTCRIKGRPSSGWRDCRMTVPGDLSAAAFFMIGATVVPDSDVTILNVGVNPTRTGVIEILRSMGGNIEEFNPREESGEPVADLRIRSAPLTGVHIDPALIPQTIDEFPILCVAAALAKGETVIRGAKELRVKESDRIHTMATELGKMGVKVSETEDGMSIQGRADESSLTRGALQGAQLTSYGDHRVAMSLAIAGLRATASSQIQDTQCIDTSFPGFHSKLLELLTKF